MQITLNSTTKIVQTNNIPARIWEGKTESGIDVHCYITRIAVSKNKDQSEFEKELQEHMAPSIPIKTIPLHLIL